ncbi:MAG: hypothetical protein A2Z69_02310 [Bacteroidetes bacterium RBG_13_44_24]|nr:MAG: hypothetical protein A2Z69_02310 [Bacteroidetes bacterium RBG_13_44_24]
MWLILIEWDGKQPPTTYYSSLHNLCLRVRGDKEFEPIVRRAGEYNKAVIVQEGAVLVPSESLARHVAYLAKEEGARSVMTGNVELSDDGTRMLTDGEREVIARFNETFKKRGRPSSAEVIERDWVITCPECVHTTIATARRVIQCPRCGGLRVSAREGTRERIARPKNYNEWCKSRFWTGHFEVPTYAQEGGKLYSVMGIEYEDEVVLGILNRAKWATPEPNLDLLDMIFCARRYYTYKDRQRFRVECCLRMYELGYPQTEVSLFEKEDEYEIIDAAMFYGGNYDELIDTYNKNKSGKI